VDIGELGQKEGTAVIYNWRWYYSVPGLALWVVLIGAIVLVKANRNPQALLILMPLLIVNLLWLGFVKLLHFPSSARVQFDPLFASYTIGVAVLWLLAHKLGNRNRFVTFLLALIIMIVIDFVGIASYGMGAFSGETMLFTAFLAVLSFAVLVGFVLAARQCRNRYSGLRFVLYLALWTVAVCLASTLVFYPIVFIIQQVPVPISTVLLVALIAGLAFGAFLYVIVFPFMILALRSSFFRERFYACLGLKSMPTTPGQADADLPDEQNPDPKTSENSDSV